MPCTSTGPVRAWGSGNWWFLAECRNCTGVRRAERLGLRRCAETAAHGQRTRRHCHAVARLAGLAVLTVAVLVRGVQRAGRGFVGRGSFRHVRCCVFCTVGHDARCCFDRCVPKIALSGFFMCADSYCIDSAHGHRSCHRVAHPAAQGQQDKHQDQNKKAHVEMITAGKNSSTANQSCCVCGLLFLACASSPIACRTTDQPPVSASSAITSATARSGKPLPVFSKIGRAHV